MSDKNNNGKNSVPQTGAAGDAPRLTVKVPLSFLPSPSAASSQTGRKIDSADISISENELARSARGSAA